MTSAFAVCCIASKYWPCEKRFMLKVVVSMAFQRRSTFTPSQSYPDTIMS